ncbi:MAG TPA: hypothetical protein VNF71_07520 [Acidimicrobiales bacterium]|nr:hypothetical protein [Acidimicrobiales bacterium]
MALMLKPGTSWWETYGRCVSVAPEAVDSMTEHRDLLALLEGADEQLYGNFPSYSLLPER